MIIYLFNLYDANTVRYDIDVENDSGGGAKKDGGVISPKVSSGFLGVAWAWGFLHLAFVSGLMFVSKLQGFIRLISLVDK